MKILIEGNDWQELKITSKDEFIVHQPNPYNNPADEIEVVDKKAGSDSNDLGSTSTEQYSSLDFFYRYRSLFGHEPSPFNLGIYQTPTIDKSSNKGQDKDKDIIKATKYIGVVPLLKISDTEKSKDMPLAKISSRFGISPTEMIKEVLSGDDYYQNPDMLSTHSYSAAEWLGLSGETSEENAKVLFGVISGLGEIDLFQNENGSEEASSTDLGIVDEYGVFEIIDFVNKAKELCKKNLKKQSQRVEENLNCKVKGRILIQKQIKYNVSKGQNQKAYCAYNKMSEDIRENQILKYALHLCQTKEGIGDSLEEDIRFCMNSLNGVPLKKCSISDFVGLKNNGAYRQYKEALNAAKKVIGRYFISYSDADDEEGINKKQNVRLSNGKVLPYFIDMNLLFEYYCRAIFSKAIKKVNKKVNKYKEINVSFELESTRQAKRVLFHVSKNYWKKYMLGDAEDQGDNLDSNTEAVMQRFFMPVYIPDIVVNYNVKKSDGTDEVQGVAAVFDAKYSDVEHHEKRSRTHQVMFYMKALGCDYGGLISPHPNKGEGLYNQSGIDFFTDISINCKDNGNPKGTEEVNPNSEPKLFYIPLDYNDKKKFTSSNDTEKYVEKAAIYLEKIHDIICEKERLNLQRKKLLEDLPDIIGVVKNKKNKKNNNSKTVSLSQDDMTRIENFLNELNNYREIIIKPEQLGGNNE